ncbi:VOC family protein [Streptomyces sp. H10-C2]|uniref:VOC family protein n=1 Tax=unclassified Streptomyces TaxID=2593676 RepID=UPI0024BAEB0F|nr:MULTISPECIES: VOC family protein [unclassified Streptomyces]MDJ0344771.1 VOC family protein [Streptomyces sp. PH10-H1]MDJ0369656.1 VOC family protein [Streptomyces sp. H10-C2]
MSETPSAVTVAAQVRVPRPRFHHVGVQTNDLENSVRWYGDFLGCRRAWSLDKFSELTHSRLPGIRELTEMVLGDVRFHLLGRAGRKSEPTESAVQFQHFCFSVSAPEDLVLLRRRWTELYESGRYTFAIDEQPTDIVTDDDGVQSFYTYDVNGLEFEFTFVPDGQS